MRCAFMHVCTLDRMMTYYFDRELSVTGRVSFHASGSWWSDIKRSRPLCRGRSGLSKCAWMSQAYTDVVGPVTT